MNCYKLDVLTNYIQSAPVIWANDAGADGNALFVDDTRCIVGTRAGKVVVFNHKGELINQWKLHSQVGAIFQDGGHVYVWCHAKHAMDVCKGSLYEICVDDVIHQFDLVDFGEVVDKACMSAGCLVLGDSRASVAVLNVEGDFLWQHTENKTNRAMLQADETGVYTSINNCVRKYSLHSGDLLWEFSASSGRTTLQSGVLYEGQVYVDVSGEVVQLDGGSGRLVRRFSLRRQRARGLVLGGGLLITGSGPTHIFDLKDGKELYKMNFAGRLDDSVSVIHSANRKMFTFWDHLYCIDLSDWSIKRALDGTVRPYCVKRLYGDATDVVIGSPHVVAPYRDDVIMECVDVDGVVMVRAVGDKYDAGKFVAVPLAWRQPGRRFAAEALEDCPLAHCYRPKGQIRMIPSETKSRSEITAYVTDAAGGTPPPKSPPKSPQKSPLKISLTAALTPSMTSPGSPQKGPCEKTLINGGTSPTSPTYVSSITIPVNHEESPTTNSDRKKRRRTGNFLSLLSVDLSPTTDDN